MKFSATFFLLLIGHFSWAQLSAIYQSNQANFDKALALYQDNQYIPAQILFEKSKPELNSSELQADCDFYIAQCAILSGNEAATSLMEQFLEDYPTTNKRNDAYVSLAQDAFRNGDYTNALKWYEQLETNGFSSNQLSKINFQKGYVNFVNKNYAEAKNYLKKVENADNYGSQAKYYLGYMAYENDNYEEAKKYFDGVADQENYKDKMGYFQADMNFKLGNFQKAIDIAIPQLKKSTAQEKSELSKIVGESYFNLKKYDDALPYLQAYKGKKNKWNNTDYYQIGYIFYQQKKYQDAINQFNKIIEGNDAIAQNAYYHLAESYYYTDQKPQALIAFKTASEMSFDKKIQEDASLNYAKLSYEIGNVLQPVPEVLKNFLNTYPNHLNFAEMQSLLINSYITSKNYTDALEILEKNKTPENKAAYQKVLFYRGLEFFTDDKISEAYSMFKKSLLQKSSDFIYARALFWRAECEYVQNNYRESVLSYKQFLDLANAKDTPEYNTANYNLGYAYFKLQEYSNALPYFTAQTTVSKDKNKQADAYIRVGDCQFIATKYWPALDAYNKAVELNTNDADYAYFQKAMGYGLLNKNPKKIEDLNKLITSYKTSPFVDDALYELANTYVSENNIDKAISTYDEIVTKHKNSDFVSKAILKQGLVYFSKDKNQNALEKFKKVAAEFPKTNEAMEAIATAKTIYIEEGNVEEYASWVKSLGYVEINNAELEEDLFESAEKQYDNNNKDAAIKSLKSFIAQFPNGNKALKANYYLAQLFYKDKKLDESIPYYQYVAKQARNEFSEISLVRLSDMFLDKEDCKTASTYLLSLEQITTNAQNILYAQTNLMQCYNDQQDFDNAIKYADKVYNNKKADNALKSDAKVIVARTSFKKNDMERAKTEYAAIQKIAKGELAAEALYYEAFFKNYDKKYEASNKVVEKFAKNYASYNYFAGKCLIVMAKNYEGLKDNFQATQILESVIENYAEYEDVKAEAQLLLDNIKANAAKTNESITK
jgi:tetratricopeptide (TPR) repeat protein